MVRASDRARSNVASKKPVKHAVLFCYTFSMTTSVTRLLTLLHGKPVGRDSLNNRYYEEKRFPKHRPPRRWVVFHSNHPEEASAITPAWHAWIHHTTKNPPTQSTTPRLRHVWQKPHQPNPTGTPKAFTPKKQINTQPYQAWKPPA